jgi:hypothetical protein
MTSTGEQMTVSAAASLLGVTARQVRNLADDGTLAVSGRVGRNLLLDAASVQRQRNLGSQRGRHWNEQTVWAALELLADGRTDRLTPAKRSKLKTRLRAMTAEQFVRAARPRASVRRYRVSTSYLSVLNESVAVTGAAAVAQSTDTAKTFGLASGGDLRTTDGYVHPERLAVLERQLHMAADAVGNVTLRATRTGRTEGNAAEAVVALDLAESPSPRERSAGLQRLDRMLRAL